MVSDCLQSPGAGGTFNSIYSHGFVRAAVCIPPVRVADPEFNAEQSLKLGQLASKSHAVLALFPELGLSAYSNEDLFHQNALLDAVKAALSRVVQQSAAFTPILIVGAPLQFDCKLFNCAVVIYRGRVLGIVPKTYLPNYREFYEKRQFTSARDTIRTEVALFDQQVPFGNDLIFEPLNVEGFKLHVEICEDVWTPIPPSSYAALAGATVLVNLSASNIVIGKADYRHRLCAGQSAKCIAAYLYSAAGPGESTTDLAWDGHAMIYENGELLAESQRFSDSGQIIMADVDMERLVQERMRMSSFNDSVSDCSERIKSIRRVPFAFQVPTGEIPLNREIPRFPFVPADPLTRDERCYEAYNIQIHGLMKRLQSTELERVIIGISGGLDSTQALIVAAKAMDRMKLPRQNILAYTMPGFATSTHTLNNARKLMAALKVTANEIDIRPGCEQMLRDISHPYSTGSVDYDVTFENVQAGQRTALLFRLANLHRGLVLGTSDLSELALGWATYGIGDHMSHYNVNVSVPKTLMQYLIRWVIASRQFDEATSAVLQSVVDTEFSPELVPHTGGDTTKPAQLTAEKIGPYDLQDFNLYYITRYGFRPSKVAFLSYHAWGDKDRGRWLDSIPKEKRRDYGLTEIKTWLELFLYRFFKISQFKRSALPNGPKLGSGGSLSPRSDWRAPSDSEAIVWLEELRKNVPL
ncbi:MAG: NAD(+) synthase [Limisphaerales bacterium]